MILSLLTLLLPAHYIHNVHVHVMCGVTNCMNTSNKHITVTLSRPLFSCIFHRENRKNSLLSWQRTLLTTLPHPGHPPLPLLHPPPPLTWPNPSLIPLRRPRHLHLRQGCVPAAASHPVTTPPPCVLTHQTHWHPHRAQRRQRHAHLRWALLLHISLRGWKGAVTEEKDSPLRTSLNP